MDVSKRLTMREKVKIWLSINNIKCVVTISNYLIQHVYSICSCLSEANMSVNVCTCIYIN